MTAAPIAPPGEFADALGALLSGAARLSAAPVWPVSDSELAGLVRRLESLNRTLAAQAARLIAEVDHRGSAEAQGATPTGVWLGGVTATSGAIGAAGCRFALDLVGFPRLFAVLDAGTPPVEQVRLGVRALRELSGRVGAETLAEAEAALAEHAGRMGLPEYQQVVAALVAAVDPDGPEPVDPDRHARRRSLRISDTTDHGMRRLTGWLDDESAATVLAALTPLAAPRPEGGQPDPRLPERRLAEALVEVCSWALDWGTEPEQGGVRPHVTVTIPMEALEGRTRQVGVLDFGGPISPEVARRLACDAEIIPVVLDSAGVPLDVGRAARTPPLGLRRAVVARDGGCTFGGCNRPSAWSEVHHVRHWAQGGATALENLVLVCRRHHAELHSGGWGVRIGGDGHPEYQPPRWIDADQRRRPGRRHPGATR